MNRVPWLLLTSLALGAACATQAPPPATTSSSETCPMAVTGTTVQTANTSDGMSTTFITSIGDVAELRKRVRTMADRMNARSSNGMGMGTGMHGTMMDSADGGPGTMMGQGMMMPAAQAQAEDVEGGARLRITPLDPARLDDMREHMQRYAQTMAGHRNCPMTAGGQP